MKEIWSIYEVQWDFLAKLCASVPADKNLVDKWLESRKPRVKPAGGRSIPEIQEEVLDSIARGEDEPDMSFSKLIFQQNNGGLCIRTATIKAHLKDCSRQLHYHYLGKIEGEKVFYTKVANGVYLPKETYWTPILREDGEQVTKADGEYEKPIHVMGPRGQMNAIKCFDYIEGARLNFNLMVLGDCVKEEDLHFLFQYGGVHGYGGERGDGEGRYVCEFKKISAADKAREKVDKAESAKLRARAKGERPKG